MKKVMNKDFIQKIAIAIIIVLSFNFVVPTFSSADFGGILWTPIRWLVTGIGDTILYWLNFFFVGLTMQEAENVIQNPFAQGSFAFVKKYSDLDATDKAVLAEKTGVKTIVLDNMDTSKEVPLITYGPDMIFSNQVPGLDANYISPKTTNTIGVTDPSITSQLQKTIASWYVSLRNFVVICLLSILLYVAIRMIISSTAADKAKYKQMLLDWIISLCLLFFMHYIMSFTMTLIEQITQAVGDATTSINIQLKDGEVFNTNITGYCRFMTQSDEGMETMGFTILYIALLIYTVKFTWEYMKRTIKMAFLTLMAPLVTLTYAIDKMSDGKAQAFNMWLKEYIFTALLQPFHLIVYSIFMSAGMSIAVSNPLYAILFLAFLTPAEKLLKKFFRIDDKSAGGSSFAGGLSGAAAFNAITGIAKKGASAASGAKDGGSNSKASRSQNNIRTQKPIEASNSPKGYSAFANNVGANGATSENNGANNASQSRTAVAGAQQNTQLTAQQRMADAYDETNFGTGNWDAQEAAGLQMNAHNADNNSNVQSSEEFANTLRDSGYAEEDIPAAMAQHGYDLSEASNQSAQNAHTESATNKKPIRGIRRVGSALAGAGLGAAKYTGGKLKQRFATTEGWKKNAAFIGRTAARTAGAGLGLAIGIGAGITGDDLGDVFKYGAAGLGFGHKVVGDQIINTGKGITNSGFAKSLGTGARESYYGGVNQAAIARQTKQLKASGELREYIGENITNSDGSRLKGKELTAYENRAIEHYNAGITDYSEIKKTLKLEDSIKKNLPSNTNMSEEDKAQIAKEQAETIAKMKVDDNKLMTDEKYSEGLQKNFKRGLKNSDSNLTDKQLQAQADQMMQLLKQYKKVD